LAALAQGTFLFIGALLCLASFVVGYYLTARRVLSREDERPLPALTRAQGDPGRGHVAVVYFTHGEPQTYDPIGWLNQFREFDEQKVPFIPVIGRPIFIYLLRRKYLQVGSSHHRETHQRMIRRLEESLRADGDTTTRFYLSFLDDNPRPDAAVIQALNEGASYIVISEVFVSISNHTKEGEDLIKSVDTQPFGAPVQFTGPLWDSDTLHSMFVKRANEHIGGTDKSKVGVILVGHGQPDEWDKEFPTETEHEIEFRRRIMRRLVEDGYRPENLDLAWMEFKHPRPAEKVEQLVKIGVEKIVYFSAAISAEAIHSQFDIPDLIAKAKVPAEFPILNLGAWNDDTIVIEAIKERILPLMPARFIVEPQEPVIYEEARVESHVR
jgi:sirohydrochlorin ferrochelatase